MLRCARTGRELGKSLWGHDFEVLAKPVPPGEIPDRVLGGFGIASGSIGSSGQAGLVKEWGVRRQAEGWSPTGAPGSSD